MEQYLYNDLDYMLGDYFEMMEFYDEVDDYDIEEAVAMDKLKVDTSSLEYRNGKDMQGIPWERLNFSREKYRELRLKQYKNYENLSHSREQLNKECKEIERGSNFYDFQFNTRLVKSTIGHFQLRNLLWATSKHDIYTTENYSIMHWSSLLQRYKEVLNVAGKIEPNKNCHETPSQSLSRIRISTMAVKDELIVAGGFDGELLLKHLNHPGVDLCAKLTTDENAITNAVDISSNSNGSIQVLTANNDRHVRVFDAENLAPIGCFPFTWSVNSASVSPNRKLLAVVGDSTDGLVVDAESAKVFGSLKGHLDYSLALAWHPDGHVLATGNQDTTCRLWDVRRLSESMAVLKGTMGAIRAIKFSSDGQFMAIAEAADFVHVYDTKTDYCKAQAIDLFGEISGLTFSPDSEALFVGVADPIYGSLLEFRRRHCFGYLNALV